MRTFATLLVFGLCFACTGDSDSDEQPADSEDTQGEDSPVDTGPQLPTNPAPFTVSMGGGYTADIVFDQPSCSNYPEGSLVNFRQFWRGSHNAVLIAEVLSTFSGAGDYNTTDHNLRVKMQSEAGAEYNFFLTVDTSQGDSATLRIDHVSNIAWGNFQATGLHGSVDGADVGAVTISGPLPIYCPAVTTQ